jgi:glutathione S-transferase
MSLMLVIGNKNYSSWSFRPWLAMKATGIEFEERVVSLSDPAFKRTLLDLSPAGKVPVLVDSDVRVWESLAILEHLAEKFPDRQLWPQAPAARAHARSLAAEMHGGFAALRRECPMNMWRPSRKRELSADATADVLRIDAMWAHSRSQFGDGGPFLFGSFGAADAMYAPVVSRFHTYGVEVGPASRDYMAAVMGLEGWNAWRAAALKEPWVLSQDEPDWPNVPREPA